MLYERIFLRPAAKACRPPRRKQNQAIYVPDQPANQPDPFSNRRRSVQQLQYRVGLLVGLREHGCAGILQDLGSGQIGGGLGVIGVQQLTFGRTEVHGHVGRVVGGMSQSVDGSAPNRSIRVNRGQ